MPSWLWKWQWYWLIPSVDLRQINLDADFETTVEMLCNAVELTRGQCEDKGKCAVTSRLAVLVSRIIYQY